MTLMTLFLVMTLAITKSIHGLKHLLHGILVAGLNMLDLPDLAEPALADDVVVAEELALEFRCGEGWVQL